MFAELNFTGKSIQSAPGPWWHSSHAVFGGKELQESQLSCVFYLWDLQGVHGSRGKSTSSGLEHKYTLKSHHTGWLWGARFSLPWLRKVGGIDTLFFFVLFKVFVARTVNITGILCQAEGTVRPWPSWCMVNLMAELRFHAWCINWKWVYKVQGSNFARIMFMLCFIMENCFCQLNRGWKWFMSGFHATLSSRQGDGFREHA